MLNTLMTYSTMKERDITNANLKKYVRLLKNEKLSEEYHGTLNKYLQRFSILLFVYCLQSWDVC